MIFFNYAWIFLYYAFFISIFFVFVAIIILLFHPLSFKLKLRATIKGQRADLCFDYFFRLLQLRLVATPNNQYFFIKFPFFKKKLSNLKKANEQEEQEKQEKQEEQKEDSKQSSDSNVEKEQTQSSSTKPATEESSEPAKTDQTTKEEKTNLSSSSLTEEPPEQPHEPEIKTGTDDSLKQASESESDSQQGQPKKTEPLKDVSQTKQEKQELFKAIRALLKKLKKQTNKQYKLAKRYINLCIKKWNALSPALKTFLERIIKAFSLIDTSLKVNYSLPEPHLTGMLQAPLSIISGIIGNYGIMFDPVPSFEGQAIYLRAATMLVIRPYQIVIAFIALLFSKNLRLELWNLFLWAYKKRKTQK